MNIKKQYLIYGILAALFIFAVIPWLKQGVPITDDYRHHATRFWFIQQEIKQGQFSEWVPFMYGGWPFFHFYHPMFYVLSLPVIALFNFILALKMMTIVAYAIALFGTFFAVKMLFKDNEIALIAAIAYFMSSHFLFHATVSGALPRLMAIALTPLASAFFIKALEEKSKIYSIVSSILLAVLFMTHTSVAIPAFILCFIYLLYELYEKRSLTMLKKGIAIFLIAIGLSAFWFLPLLLEKNYANFAESTAKLDVPTIDQSTRTFGIVHNAQHFVRSNYFGYLTLALAILSTIFVNKNKSINAIKIGFLASLFFYFNIFGLLNYIPFLNTALTGSTSFFISTIVFSAAILAGIGAKSIGKSLKNNYLVYLIAILIIIELNPALNAFSYSWVNQQTENFVNPPQLIEAFNFIKNQEGIFSVFTTDGQAAEAYHGKNEFGFEWVGCPQCVQKKTYEIHNQILSNFTNGIKNDALLGYFGVKYYLVPCQYKLNNKLAFSNNAFCVYENEKFRPIVESDAQITEINQNLDKMSFKTKSSKENAVLVKINYFKPHWHAYVNGKETEIKQAWPEFMQITVPAGENNVVFEYKTNTLHIVSWFITFLTACLAVYYIKKR